jgi:hypothetical protein
MQPKYAKPLSQSEDVWDQGAADSGTTPLGLMRFSRLKPRVASRLAGQPWAGGHNPFGIANAWEGQTLPTKHQPRFRYASSPCTPPSRPKPLSL